MELKAMELLPQPLQLQLRQAVRLAIITTSTKLWLLIGTTMVELGDKPMPFGTRTMALGERWLRFGITMGGRGDESIAEN